MVKFIDILGTYFWPNGQNIFGRMVKIRPFGFLFFRPSGFGRKDKFEFVQGNSDSGRERLRLPTASLTIIFIGSMRLSSPRTLLLTF